MDYGHANPQGAVPLSPEEQAFFTPGVGNIPASENDPNQINDINTSQDPWAYNPEHDNAAIGNKVISNPETFGSSNIQPNVDYGTIVPIGQPAPTISAQENAATIYDQTAIRTEGDHLGKNAIVEIRKVENKLSRDGDLNSYYNEIRKMTSVNLKNSYNRELGKAA